MTSTVHVIGAGLAGLAAAVRLCQHGTGVVLHEAAGQAGGRCRSYHDPALDMVIDNGNHLLPGSERTVCETVKCAGPLYDRLARPLWLAALNTDPKEASARLAAAVTRETLAKGGKACRPLFASEGLSQAFVEPALSFLQERRAKVEFSHRLRALDLGQDRVTALDFGDDGRVAVEAGDSVILATPPAVSADLIPGLKTPEKFRAIINAHFRIEPPSGLAPILGIINGTIEWLFSFKHRLSVTISCADRLLEVPREALAGQIWQEVAAVAGLSKAMPPWQIVRERRATFAATPAENAKRPGAETAWKNLFLAGDWTNTGLPATIEGAIRSGNRSADLVSAS
jgi:squalene-associated FAD-dependent desaturase